MKRRSKISMSGSKRLFRSTADRVHPKNAPALVMRGGIRL